MISLRKHYIKKREQNLKEQASKHIILIFNKNTLSHPLIKTKQIATIQQTFIKYVKTQIGVGGNTLQVKIKDPRQLIPALKAIPFNLIAVQIEEKWYTGPLIKKFRFENFNKKLFSLLVIRQRILNKF